MHHVRWRGIFLGAIYLQGTNQKLPYITYNVHVITIFCNLHSFLLIFFEVYALQKWWEKAWQQKGIKNT
jgi:hypothetical protein